MASHYRHISLLNVDVKLYAKVLANRILPLLHKLISLDQVGFISGREARDNTIKAINIHHWLITSKPGFMLSLDVEKAFDRVAWDYNDSYATSYGFPRYFSPTDIGSLLVTHCQDPSQWLPVGRLLHIKWHTPGMPPVPYYLCAHHGTPPYADYVPTDIKGIEVKSKTYKTAAYADDILLFLSDPTTTIPNLVKDFALFKNISNLQMHFLKLKALN